MTPNDRIDQAGRDSFPASDPPAYGMARDNGAADVGPYTLPPLPYAYDDLQPVIDQETMQLHHDRHHRAYVEALNKALAAHPEWLGLTIETLMARLAEVPAEIRQAVRNHGGGHANHALFWNSLTRHGHEYPAGDLAAAIDRDFVSLVEFKEKFEAAGVAHFGSGWVFLTTDPHSAFKLEITAMPNQDTPLSSGKGVLLACDLWEHAYYLKYQNRRADWLKAFWGIVDWNTAGRRLAAARGLG